MSYQKMAVCYDTQSCIKCFACIVSCSTENSACGSTVSVNCTSDFTTIFGSSILNISIISPRIVSCSTENRMRLQRDYNYSVEKSMVEPHHHLNYLRVECNEKVLINTAE